MGSVPAAAPMVPLARDLDQLQRALRLKPSATETTVVLDLRKQSAARPLGAAASARLLGIAWGTPADAGRTTGTFKEGWTLLWQPEFAVAARGSRDVRHHRARRGDPSRHRNEQCEEADLGALGGLVEQCFLADLPEALAEVISGHRDRRPRDSRTSSRCWRPSSRWRAPAATATCVRPTPRMVAEVLDTVVARASVDLRPGCASLDDEAACRMRKAVEAAQRGISLVEAEPAVWRDALLAVAADDAVHGLVSGRVNRILLDLGALTTDDVASRRLSRRLSIGTPPVAGAAWLDGFLEGDVVLLLHDEELLGSSTTGSARSTRRRSRTCCRCCGARSPGSRHRSDASSARTSSAGRRSQPRPRGHADLDWDRALPAVRRMAELLGLEVP